LVCSLVRISRSLRTGAAAQRDSHPIPRAAAASSCISARGQGAGQAPCHTSPASISQTSHAKLSTPGFRVGRRTLPDWRRTDVWCLIAECVATLPGPAAFCLLRKGAQFGTATFVARGASILTCCSASAGRLRQLPHRCVHRTSLVQHSASPARCMRVGGPTEPTPDPVVDAASAACASLTANDPTTHPPAHPVPPLLP
jgi:hypothetical protein